MESKSCKLLEFLEKSGPGLYGLLTRLTLREGVAEDLMQDLFMKLSNSKNFETVANQYGYASRAAINLAFDWRRSRQREAEFLNNMSEPVSKDNSPLSKLIQDEAVEEILEKVGELNGMSREVFVMHYLEQYSYEEIAKAIGKDPHHVRVFSSRAMSQLRGLLGHGKAGSFRKGGI